jgi:short-subunit dehydrogenase
MQGFSSIVITGASSGIGRALAVAYAGPGIALALTGRDRPRLQAVAEACRARGAAVETGLIDVVDRAGLTAFLTAFDDAHPVDCLIANAGVSLDKGNSQLTDFSVARLTLDVNLGGVLNTVEPLVARMMERQRGQIGIVSSLAGFVGLPYSASYNASKAAVRVWGESIRYVLKRTGVGVSVICPGFVVSGITAGAPFPMPFLMSAERAASIIRRGLARNKPRIAFPFGTKAAVWLATVLPASWTARVLGG